MRFKSIVLLDAANCEFKFTNMYSYHILADHFIFCNIAIKTRQNPVGQLVFGTCTHRPSLGIHIRIIQQPNGKQVKVSDGNLQLHAPQKEERGRHLPLTSEK